MNPNLCRVALRPRGPMEVFDLTLRFVRERARPLGILAAWTCLPVFVVCALGAWWSEGHWGWLVLAVALAPAIHAPYTVLAGRLLFAEETSVWSAVVATFRSLGGLLPAWGIGLIGVCLVGACGIGAIALPVIFYVPETALLERVGPSRGLRRSVRLATGHLPTALVGAIARWALPAWAGIAFEVGGHSVVGSVLQVPNLFGSLLDGYITPYFIAGVIVAQPLVAILRLMLYVDVRTRMEGWDLQVGLRAAGLEEAP